MVRVNIWLLLFVYIVVNVNIWLLLFVYIVVNCPI